jgi:hypothetical protein
MDEGIKKGDELRQRRLKVGATLIQTRHATSLRDPVAVTELFSGTTPARSPRNGPRNRVFRV